MAPYGARAEPGSNQIAFSLGTENGNDESPEMRPFSRQKIVLMSAWEVAIASDKKTAVRLKSADGKNSW